MLCIRKLHGPAIYGESAKMSTLERRTHLEILILMTVTVHVHVFTIVRFHYNVGKLAKRGTWASQRHFTPRGLGACSLDGGIKKINVGIIKLDRVMLW